MVKAQSAIEYLTTYGWMLIAVGVLTGVAGVLYQDTCVKSSSGLEGSAIAVNQFGLSSNEELSMSILNSKSHNITVERLEASTDEGVRPVTLNEDLKPGRTNQVDFQGFKSFDGCNSFEIKIYYRERNLDNQHVSGTVRLNAELDDSPFAIAEANGTRSTITAATGQKITFDASKSGDPRGQPLSFEWDLNNTDTGSSEKFNYSYSNGGTYEVELNVTNSDGLSSQDYIEVEVVEGINAVAKAHNETNIFEKNYLEAYEGENITLNASETAPSVPNYQWDLDNGTILNGETLKVEGFDPGEYDITLTAENSAGDTGQDNVILNVTTLIPSAPTSLEFE